MTETIPDPETWYKTCTKCGIRQPLKGFHADKRRVDGRKSWCRRCVGLYTQDWRKSRRKRDKEKERLRKQARQLAYQRLARLEPDKFQMLFQQEMVKKGVPQDEIERIQEGLISNQHQ